MSDFKKGDKVVVVRAGECRTLEDGQVLTVKLVDSYYGFENLYFEERDRKYKADRFEKYICDGHYRNKETGEVFVVEGNGVDRFNLFDRKHFDLGIAQNVVSRSILIDKYELITVDSLGIGDWFICGGKKHKVLNRGNDWLKYSTKLGYHIKGMFFLKNEGARPCFPPKPSEEFTIKGTDENGEYVSETIKIGENTRNVFLNSNRNVITGQKEMPSPSPEDLESRYFNAIFDEIKSWDINVPEYYNGYCGGNGSHAKVIYDAMGKVTDELILGKLKNGETYSNSMIMQFMDLGCFVDGDRLKNEDYGPNAIIVYDANEYAFFIENEPVQFAKGDKWTLNLLEWQACSIQRAAQEFLNKNEVKCETQDYTVNFNTDAVWSQKVTAKMLANGVWFYKIKR